MWIWLSCVRTPVAPADAPPPVPPPLPASTWRWWTTTVHSVEVSICVPDAPRVVDSVDLGTFGITELLVGSPVGPVTWRVMASTSGVFPMTSNFPDGTTDEVLVDSAEGDDGHWWFTTRSRSGPERGLTARIPDQYGEDVICSARADVGPGVDDAAVQGVLATLCRSMRLSTVSGDACDRVGP